MGFQQADEIDFDVLSRSSSDKSCGPSLVRSPKQVQGLDSLALTFDHKPARDIYTAVSPYGSFDVELNSKTTKIDKNQSIRCPEHERYLGRQGVVSSG